MISSKLPRSSSITLVLLASLQACSGESASEAGLAPPDPGRLVIVGGALEAENSAVYEAVMAGREGGGPLCVIPTASADAAGAMSGAVQTLEGYAGGGPVTGVLLSTENPELARDSVVASTLMACAGYYFTGGSQSRILDVFLPDGDTTVAYQALRQRWQEGAVVAGSSAGAAMMSRRMISGGSSAEAVSAGLASGADQDGVQVRDGMGFFDPLLDQHFLARGRIGRLLVSAIRDDLPRVGFGIDENTALVVDGDSARVVGASGVIVVDARAARSTGENRASNVSVYLAGAGDIVDLATLEVRRDENKVRVPVRDTVFEVPKDPFARWQFLHVLSALSTTGAPAATFTVSGATLSVARAPGFSAAMFDVAGGVDGGVEGTPLGLAAGPFRIDLLGPGA